MTGGDLQPKGPLYIGTKYLSDQETVVFDPAHMDTLMKYGFDKKKATVSKDKTIVCNKRKYVVVVGAEKFSS